MSAANAKALKEAQSFMKQAEKAIKKTVFHKPDFGDGGNYYGKAADIFMKAKMFKEAKEAYERGAEAYCNEGVELKSGDFYVNAARCALQLNEPQEIKRLMLEGKCRYLEGDQALQAVRQLKDIAVRVKSIDPNVTYELYDQLLEVVENEKQYHWEKDTFVDFAMLCYDLKRYQDCFNAFDRAKKAFLALNNTDGAAHCVVSAIVINLQRGDVVAAEKIFNAEMQEDYFIRTDDFSMIDFVIRGVKNRDGDILELGKKNVIVQFLKPEIARMIYAFKAPKAEPMEELAKMTAPTAKPTPPPQPKAPTGPAVVVEFPPPPGESKEEEEAGEGEEQKEQESNENNEEIVQPEAEKHEEEEDWLL